MECMRGSQTSLAREDGRCGCFRIIAALALPPSLAIAERSCLESIFARALPPLLANSLWFMPDCK